MYQRGGALKMIIVKVTFGDNHQERIICSAFEVTTSRAIILYGVNGDVWHDQIIPQGYKRVSFWEYRKGVLK